jgi:hypothetical protein
VLITDQVEKNRKHFVELEQDFAEVLGTTRSCAKGHIWLKFWTRVILECNLIKGRVSLVNSDESRTDSAIRTTDCLRFVGGQRKMRGWITINAINSVRVRSMYE